MSASFSVAGEAFSGSTGSIEAYVEAMAAHAEKLFGADDSLTLFLQAERDSFWGGKFVFLDEWLQDTPARARFVTLLDAATEQLRQEGTFSQIGQRWVATVMSKLREKIVGLDEQSHRTEGET